MPKLRQCFDVLIASPSDVTAERSILVECIEDWNAINSVPLGAMLLPRRWELDIYPELGGNPQDLIDEQIVKDADLVLAVFWHRIGTATPKALSGTVQEITHFVESGKEASLYFSQAALPFDHDAEQLQKVKDYKKSMLSKGVVSDFHDPHEFRRMAMRHLSMKMNKLLAQHPIQHANKRGSVRHLEASANVEPDPVKLILRKGQKGRSGDVPTVAAVVEIVNASEVRLKEYTCVLTVPAAALTFASSVYVLEVKSDDAGLRSFRVTEQNAAAAPIHPKETRQILAIELGVEQLRLADTYLAGDYEGTRGANVIADAWIEGKHYRQTMKVAEFFA